MIANGLAFTLGTMLAVCVSAILTSWQPALVSTSPGTSEGTARSGRHDHPARSFPRIHGTPKLDFH